MVHALSLDRAPARDIKRAAEQEFLRPAFPPPTHRWFNRRQMFVKLKEIPCNV